MVAAFPRSRSFQSPMSLLQLLKQEAGPDHHRIVITAALAGIANALLLATLNTIAQSPATTDFGALFLFFVCLATFVLNTRYATHRITDLIETLLHRIKLRIGNKLLTAELEALEQINAAEICDRLTENTTLVSARAGRLATMIHAGFVVPFATLYIAWLSPAAFMAVVLIGSLGALKFLDVRRKFVASMQESAQKRVVFLERMTDLLLGFKEIQFGRRRRRDLRNEVLDAADAVRIEGIVTSNIFTDGNLVGGSILFAVLAAVVYTLQIYVPLDAASMMSVVSAVMFLWGPFVGFILGLMPYTRSEMAIQEMLELEKKFDRVAREKAPNPKQQDPWKKPLEILAAHDLEYEYIAAEANESFRIGPVNLQINAGEVVFIVGGNGSGKSTLIKVLSGIYAPSSGYLELDGVRVDRDNVLAYRDRISAVFSDFHLFSKLYGMEGLDEDLVQQWIVRMRLTGQVVFADGAFKRLKLSTGQKKRLALIVLLLESRPICIFDEWAAEQDPEFRQYFYEELLPNLRRQGKTVLVVTHDDRYFHHADRVVTMEYGRVHSIVPQYVARGAA